MRGWWCYSNHWAAPQLHGGSALHRINLTLCIWWSAHSGTHLSRLLGVAGGVHSSSPAFKTAEEKTRCWLCWKPWSSFKETMMTWKDLPDFTKKQNKTKTKWRKEHLIVCMCVWQREMHVSVYSFAGSKWIGVHSCLLFCCSHEKKVLFRKIKSVFKATERKLLSQHRGFEVRAVHCTSQQRRSSSLICSTT